ncbi:csnB [Candida jiufengensis]|uniref:csnB n=1 Tax=Candida jiufengensis TaxID=497108 RepID=UPI002224A084|nr:csnB [Candida jiufengensis]KAI5952323.1 csnB [Candida jiufengensis]
MSDEELFSEDSYEFEFEDEDGNDGSDQGNDNIEEDEDQGLENRYYTAKSLKDDDIQQSIKELQKVIDSIKKDESQEDSNEWIFKSYKQLIKIYYNEGEYEKVLSNLQHIIPYLSKLNKSYIEESLSRMIGRYLNNSNNNNTTKQTSESKQDFIIRFSEILNNQSGLQNDKLWLKLNSNLLNFYLETNQFDKFAILIEEIHQKLPYISEPIKKLFNLEIIASEIEFLFKTNSKDLIRLNKLYKLSLNNSTAVTHPKILGIINECGGKVQFYRENFESSKNLFYNSFKNYDEAGSLIKNKILKYVLLISLLGDNDNLDNFQSQETQTYSQFNEFNNLKKLIKNYRGLELNEFLNNLKEYEVSGDEFFADEIFKKSIDIIFEKLRVKLLLKILVESKNKAITFKDLVHSLQINEYDFEFLLLKLIGQGKLTNFKIDFVQKSINYESEGIDSKTFLFPTDAEEIYYSVKLLDNFDITPKNNTTTTTNDNDMMTDDTTIREEQSQEQLQALQIPQQQQQQTNLLSKLFYLTERPNKPEDWFSSINMWYTYIMSYQPKQHKLTPNTEIITTNINASEELENFNTGLLNSTVNEEDGGDDDLDDENLISVKKLHLIKSWINKLKD